MKRRLFAFLIFLLAAINVTNVYGFMPPNSNRATSSNELRFIENKNQYDPSTFFMGKLSCGQLRLEKDNFEFITYKADYYEKYHHHIKSSAAEAQDSLLNIDIFRLQFVNASENVRFEAIKPDTQRLNFFQGNNPEEWATDVRQFKQVKYLGIYPGIDMEVFGQNEHIKYNWLLAAGADASAIKVQYRGVKQLRLEKGNLLYEVPSVAIREEKPIAYQEVNGEKKEVPVRFVLEGDEIHFEFPRDYNHGLPLVIDPTLIFSSYTGSTADNWGFTATYDQHGNLYAGGVLWTPVPGRISGSYPTIGAIQTTFQGGTFDMAISKFNSTGTTMLYSTILGGNNDDRPYSMVVNSNDELYILGSTNSNNFPMRGAGFDRTANGNYDIVVEHLNAAGNAILNSTYLGGSSADGFFTSVLCKNYSDESRSEIALDTAGNVYVASYSLSSNFPTTAGAFQTSLHGMQDAVVIKMPADLSTLTFSTYLGGNGVDAGFSMKLDHNNNIFVCGGTTSTDFPGTASGFHRTNAGGIDGYVCRMNNTGTAVSAATYVGTSDYDQAYFIEVDRYDNIYLYGQSLGNYPIVGSVYSNPGSKQFIQKLDNRLSTGLLSTVIGSGGPDVNISPTAFLVDRCDNIYLSGWGGNVNDPSEGGIGGNTFGMPITSGALYSSTDGSDFYFMVLERNARALLYATYYGGTGSVGEHVDGGTSRFDKDGVIYEAICSGCGGNSLFPSTPGAWSTTNNSSNCNLSAMKLAFNLGGTSVNVSASPRSTGCVPLTVNFHSVLVNVVNVTWNFGDGTFSHSYNPIHTFTDTGSYTVMLIGTDSASCNVVDTAFLSVDVRDDSITANFIPNQIIDCHNKVFKTKVHNYPTTTYLWNFGDGSTANTDSVYHVYASPGTYHVTLNVFDPNSCNGINNYAADIVIKPFAYLNTNLRDTSGCFPLRLSYINRTTSTGPFHWDFGDGSSSTLASPSHTYANGGVYQILLTMNDSSKCNIVDTARAQVQVFNDTVAPLFDIQRIFYGCDSGRVILHSYNTTANRLIWDLGDGTRSNAFFVTHDYHGAVSYIITYIVIDSSKHCRIADTVQEMISLNPIVASFGISDTNGCIPLLVSFSDSSGYPDAISSWTFGDGGSAVGMNVSHTYFPVNYFRVQHIVLDSSVCNFADTTYGDVRTRNDSTQAYFDGTILNACDSQLIIQFNNHSIDATQYEWHFGDGAVSTLTNPLHTYTLPGTYQVMMISIDTHKCHPRDTAYSSYIMNPNAIANFDVLPVACSGVSVTFNNHSHLGAAFTWFFGDSSHANGYNVSHTYTASGNYTITMIIADTSTCNTFDTLTRNIKILDFPHADFVMDRDSFYYLDQIQFTNRSIHFTDLLWRFGDGDTSIDTDPMHQYAGIFHQQPCVIAYISGTGCADTFCRDIFIHYDPIIGVPNAFSPNGDGVNDEVRVEGSGITELDFRIYNRWGELVFRSNEKNKGWNGMYKGVLQEMDVYVYSVQAKFLDNSKKTLTGNITLLR